MGFRESVDEVVRAAGLIAGRITITVQHPGRVAHVDVSHRLLPDELTERDDAIGAA